MQTSGHATIKLLALGTFLLLLLGSSVLQAEAVVSCGTVSSALGNCATYLLKGTPKPAMGSPCCSAVRGLNSKFTFRADRQAVCRCMKDEAIKIKPNPVAAQNLPGACGVNLGYAISLNTNCDVIH